MPTSATRYSSVRRFAVAVACVVAAVSSSREVYAGGSAENVFLVVNERSWSSLSIANHYIKLRDIPPSNVLYLDWRGDNERITAAECREKLLKPIFLELHQRGIADHIDYIVYSSDFPWMVDCSADATPEQLPPVLAPHASLTGATFFHEWFGKGQSDFRFFRANGYFRPHAGQTPPNSQGFRSWYGWNEEGRLLEAGGMNYMLSTMLGVTSGRGNSTSEVLAALTASVKADYSQPKGKIYFAKNDDVRSTTRHDLFPAVVDAIKNHGAGAEIVEGRIPSTKLDVAGMMLGTSDFSLPDSRSKIQPGAICETLTSHSGTFYESAGQTPISSFVRGGAAITAGAVVEPFAVPQKFPDAYMHLHYVRGCTAGEAYYQATNGPYQMIVLGDPLCAAWAKPAHVVLDGLNTDSPLKGVVRFIPGGGFEGGLPTGRFEFYVDGLYYFDCLPGEGFALDTRALTDGRHEFRVVAVGKEPLESRAATVVSVVVANQERSVTLTRNGDPEQPWRWGKPATVRLAAVGEPAPVGILLVQGTRRLGQIAGASGEIAVDTQSLGIGPVRLQAFALSQTGDDVASAPLDIYVEPGEPLPTYQLAGGGRFDSGMLALVGDKKPKVLSSVTFDAALQDAGVKPGDDVMLTGMFSVDEDGVYQFHIRHAANMELLLDDQALLKTSHDESTTDYIPIPLSAGLHKLTLRLKFTQAPQIDVRFGLRGVQMMRPASMTHEVTAK
ncbi:MAG: hypothetical protein QM775_31570 [Pirellulales bacterium]